MNLQVLVLVLHPLGSLLLLSFCHRGMVCSCPSMFDSEDFNGSNVFLYAASHSYLHAMYIYE